MGGGSVVRGRRPVCRHGMSRMALLAACVASACASAAPRAVGNGLGVLELLDERGRAQLARMGYVVIRDDDLRRRVREGAVDAVADVLNTLMCVGVVLMVQLTLFCTVLAPYAYNHVLRAPPSERAYCRLAVAVLAGACVGHPLGKGWLALYRRYDHDGAVPHVRKHWCVRMAAAAAVVLAGGVAFGPHGLLDAPPPHPATDVGTCVSTVGSALATWLPVSACVAWAEASRVAARAAIDALP